jgi:predicted RNase H-like nuclease (RuvC/YqgF family)
MTIKEANVELRRKNNELNYWINKKNYLISKLYPGATKYDSMRVEGGKRTDKYKHLDYTIDEIDPKIETLNNEIKILSKYIEEELKIIGEYEPLERKIIMLRNEYKMKWKDISEATNYCERQCQRIYDKYYKRARKTRNNL